MAKFISIRIDDKTARSLRKKRRSGETKSACIRRLIVDQECEAEAITEANTSYEELRRVERLHGSIEARIEEFLSSLQEPFAALNEQLKAIRNRLHIS